MNQTKETVVFHNEKSTENGEKNSWIKNVLKIAYERTWNELIEHFKKHLEEMRDLDAGKFPDRATNKAHSLIDLCAFASAKMKVPIVFFDSFDSFSHFKLNERIEEHEKKMENDRNLEKINKAKLQQKLIDDDTD